MKIPSKRELQKIVFNHSSVIYFMNLYKRCTAKLYSFLIINTTLSSDSPLCLKTNIHTTTI